MSQSWLEDEFEKEAGEKKHQNMCLIDPPSEELSPDPTRLCDHPTDVYALSVAVGTLMYVANIAWTMITLRESNPERVESVVAA